MKLKVLLRVIGVVQLILGAFGIGMLIIANAPEKNLFWINNMILIQVVDLAVGIFYTSTGTVAIAHSGFPMFNATLFIILLSLWRPKATVNA